MPGRVALQVEWEEAIGGSCCHDFRIQIDLICVPLDDKRIFLDNARAFEEFHETVERCNRSLIKDRAFLFGAIKAHDEAHDEIANRQVAAIMPLGLEHVLVEGDNRFRFGGNGLGKSFTGGDEGLLLGIPVCPSIFWNFDTGCGLERDPIERLENRQTLLNGHFGTAYELSPRESGV